MAHSKLGLRPRIYPICATSIGSLAGFSVGFLTRPKLPLIGEKAPIEFLWQPVVQDFAVVKTELIDHMLVVTAIGAAVGFAVNKFTRR
ncbi:hypothetical protein [Agrobacterium tumefaciens]|uniref:hypothetical protein n=1 Tax=Agrobacterium tumefaciens TaxID=358 RepID=UPI001572E28B|nr:hypothetical protein [Agrobacterium tumefaciens]